MGTTAKSETDGRDGQICFRCPPDLKQALDEELDDIKYDVPKSEVMRTALREYLKVDE